MPRSIHHDPSSPTSPPPPPPPLPTFCHLSLKQLHLQPQRCHHRLRPAPNARVPTRRLSPTDWLPGEERPAPLAPRILVPPSGPFPRYDARLPGNAAQLRCAVGSEFFGGGTRSEDEVTDPRLWLGKERDRLYQKVRSPDSWAKCPGM